LKKLILTLTAILIGAASLLAQEKTEAKTELRQLVNTPTAGVLGRGQYEFGMRLFANGGVLTNINVGITNRFMIGISYGGENFIGTGKVNFNPEPGVDARYRLIDESMIGPGVTVGFDNQGFGRYLKKIQPTDLVKVNRYSQKARGLFAVASKNYAFMGNIGFHGGMNWDVTEKKDKDNQLDFFLGVDKSINEELSLVGEYDFAFNDNRGTVGHKRGYLNIGAKLNFHKVMVEFLMTDLFNNSRNIAKYSREIKLSFVNAF
jgi:hypothetical protein